MSHQLMSVVGFFVLLAIGYALSRDRKAVQLRVVLWGVGLLFILGVVVGIGAIVGGRAFSMPHASKAGVVGIVLVFAAIIGYLVLPGIVRAMTGSGCV